jgi:hypothetical protein
MVAPPLLAGAVKATLICALPAVATSAVGAPAVTAAGVALVLLETVPSPIELTALRRMV